MACAKGDIGKSAQARCLIGFSEGGRYRPILWRRGRCRACQGLLDAGSSPSARLLEWQQRRNHFHDQSSSAISRTLRANIPETLQETARSWEGKYALAFEIGNVLVDVVELFHVAILDLWRNAVFLAMFRVPEAKIEYGTNLLEIHDHHDVELVDLVDVFLVRILARFPNEQLGQLRLGVTGLVLADVDGIERGRERIPIVIPHAVHEPAPPGRHLLIHVLLADGDLLVGEIIIH